MKNNLDERQYQEVSHIAANAFYVMFMISAASIVVQLVLLNQEISSVLGETIALLGGGSVYLICLMKKGIFSFKNNQMTITEIVLGSVICSGFFSIWYGIAIASRLGDEISLGRYVGGFFTGITLLCVVVLYVMSRCAMHFQKKNEKKYDE